MMSDDSMHEMSLCARLRNERERRQISLSSICANTKISGSLLQALERGDLSRWPSGIFRRSFIRLYAEAIGLDPDSVAREFFEEFPDPFERPTGTAPAPATHGSPVHSEGAGLRLKLADAPTPFVAGRLLGGMRQRLAAVGCDAGVIAVIALCVFIMSDKFWLPMGVVMLGYYLGGILILGNTPGVCLLAPGSPDKGNYPPPPDDTRESHDAREAPHSSWHLGVPAR
jgi:transcriptional regulator with XRE-family HTH domain